MSVEPVLATPAPLITVIEGVRYVLGLEWRLIPPTRALQRTLSLARKELKSKYVLTDMEDIIGLSGPVPGKWGSTYSAAIHLASRMAQGGLELYVFEVPKQQYMVIALNESRPVPGFDFLGTASDARALIDEFLAIQQGQSLRFVGNTGWLEGEENVAVEDIFVSPSRGARLKHLPARHVFKWLLGLAALVGLSVAGSQYWLESEREELMVSNPEVPPSPVMEYQLALRKALAELPPAGPVLLQQWQALIRSLPLMHAGWRLQDVACDVTTCTAQWVRVYGTYDDFFKQLPGQASDGQEVQTGDDALHALVLTHHPVPKHTASAPMQAAKLPPMNQALRSLSSHLQDFSLLGQVHVEISKPTLFAGTQDPAKLPEAVMTGVWKIKHDAATLSHLQVPDYGVPQKLSLQIAGSSDKPAMSYEFSGQYYVQAIHP